MGEKETTHENIESAVETEEPVAKKARFFAPKSFRKQLHTEEKTSALTNFLKLIKENRNEDCVVEYLDSGGNCLEILQILEVDSTVPPTLVFEIVYNMLLRIRANLIHYQSHAYEACRYILNTYITMFNKMLGLSSTAMQRKTILKLLTAVVTFSPSLAKDVLLQISFNPTNIELLCKPTGEKDNTRNAFINFLTAFLVDGHYPTLAALLEKRGLLSSIIKDLQYDAAECVCMVITALKNHVLENPLVSKTVKMHTFSTPVVKDIVNLYNWKGPQKVKKKGVEEKLQVDEYGKSRVSECVHEFLLCLCTSHKYGVIFRDQTLGLSKKHQNSLMYTVLEGLERPWMHSYAGELVIKICKACPELTRGLWSSVKAYLEPRATKTWLATVQFAERLLMELDPCCIEFCAKDLTISQLVQTVQFLVCPTPILKTIIPENNSFENHATKIFILRLLLIMLNRVSSYVKKSELWVQPDQHHSLKHLLSEHISRNFPNALDILSNWEMTAADAIEDFETFTPLEYLKVALQVMQHYKNLCPSHLETFSTSFNAEEFLGKILSITEEKDGKKLFVDAVNLIMAVDPVTILPNKHIFDYSVPLLLEFYHEEKSDLIKETLFQILNNTSIFEGLEEEINVWIEGVLNAEFCDSKLCLFVLQSVKKAYTKTNEYLELLSQLFNSISTNYNTSFNVREYLENLAEEDTASSLPLIIRHTSLSPLIIGTLDTLLEEKPCKSVKHYIQFVLFGLCHMQTDLNNFFSVVTSDKYREVIPENLLLYITNWKQNLEPLKIKKFKGRLDFLKIFSESFLNGNFERSLSENENHLLDQKLNILYLCLFYFTNMVQHNVCSETHLNNFSAYIKYLNDKVFFQTIFKHPVVLQNFTPINNDKDAKHLCTRLVEVCVKEMDKLPNKKHLELYLSAYRNKLVSSVLKMIKKSHKQKYNYRCDELLELIKIFKLESFQCVDILTAISHQINKHGVAQDNPVFKILMCIFSGYIDICRNLNYLEPLSRETVMTLSNYLKTLVIEQSNVPALCQLLHDYLQIFPHDLEAINVDLFESILLKTEYCKESSELAVKLFQKDSEHSFNVLKQNVSNVCTKKGLILPLLHVAVGNKFDDLEDIYKHLKPSILKALEKPQKAGKHYEIYYSSVAHLLEKYLDAEECTNILLGSKKYETSEPFHAHLLKIVFEKAILSQDSIQGNVLSKSCMCFVHMMLHLFKKKTDEEWPKLKEIVSIFHDFINKLSEKLKEKGVSGEILTNDSFKLFCKFCLKFGISGEDVLLKTLALLVEVLHFTGDDISLIEEMIVSHSEFLDVVLNEESSCKTELLRLFLVLCKKSPQVLQRNHVPLVLAAYRGTVTRADRYVLEVIKVCEARAAEIGFYDFKPFLFGRSAAAHYSVRSDIQNALWKQPKVNDVLNILQESYVLMTIKNQPLRLSLNSSETDVQAENPHTTYDMSFILPLLDQLLAPENAVQTYRFTRSGAITLVISALSNYNEDVRKAACHVLSRFYHHVEARQTGKDNPLWLRFIEAVCKGTAVLEDFHLNSFAAIFFARMSLVLTQPGHVMYVALSHYLGAKSAPDLSGIPELYTLLHSADVNYKEHRSFILEILKDGMRTKRDFQVALRSMAFKLIMELYNSCISDLDTRVQILQVFKQVVKVTFGITVLCTSCGFLSWLVHVTKILDSDSAKTVLPVVIDILLGIVSIPRISDKPIDLDIIGFILSHIIDEHLNSIVKQEVLILFLQVIDSVLEHSGSFCTENRLKQIIQYTGNKRCEYFLKYGCKYVKDVDDSLEKGVDFYVTKITLRYIMSTR